jgi:formate hydrogenlyase subunit 6/NADH:ubiquinone oxidoreductase subunit I
MEHLAQTCPIAAVFEFKEREKERVGERDEVCFTKKVRVKREEGWETDRQREVVRKEKREEIEKIEWRINNRKREIRVE